MMTDRPVIDVIDLQIAVVESQDAESAPASRSSPVFDPLPVTAPPNGGAMRPGSPGRPSRDNPQSTQWPTGASSRAASVPHSVWCWKRRRATAASAAPAAARVPKATACILHRRSQHIKWKRFTSTKRWRIIALTPSPRPTMGLTMRPYAAVRTCKIAILPKGGDSMSSSKLHWP
jgi:hypothetical protein